MKIFIGREEVGNQGIFKLIYRGVMSTFYRYLSLILFLDNVSPFVLQRVLCGIDSCVLVVYTSLHPMLNVDQAKRIGKCGR